MSIQNKFFRIPAVDSSAAEDELNRFLRSVKPVMVQKEFVALAEYSFWAVAVEYISDGNSSSVSGKKSKIDYKAVLSPEDFAVFARLRDWRKKAAMEEGVPPYVIFTNEQLARMTEQRMTSMTQVRSIDGIGEARVKKYGNAAIGIIQKHEQQDLGKAES